jgi:AraC family transcriptional regulator
MHYVDIQPVSSQALTLRRDAIARYPDKVVADETRWRATPAGDAGAPKIAATRWHSTSEGTREASAPPNEQCHVVAILRRSMNVRFSVADRTVHDGAVAAGMMHVAAPGVPTQGIFRGPYDVLHLHVPSTLIAECARDIPADPAPILPSAPTLFRDPVVERLGMALLRADDLGGPFGQLYADCINVAIVARLLASAQQAYPERSAERRSERPRVSGLPKWRLKRATDYIEAHLAESVSLADIAAVTGLTRMHFAAQFRAATGLRPHEYLLRRRVERAQEMLLRQGQSVVDVAMAVGFQTQAHFTSVFKRFVGQPPHAWRRNFCSEN